MDETGARIEVCEIVKSFEVFANEHATQQKVLQDQLMTCVKGMFSNTDSSVGSKKKMSYNRVSLGTVNSLMLYLTAQQRLVTSLMCDIAEGRIGKGFRKRNGGPNFEKLKMSKKMLEDVKLNSTPKNVATEARLEKLSKRLVGAPTKNKATQNYFYSPHNLLDTLEQNKN